MLRAFKASSYRNRRLIILCFHSVADTDEMNWYPWCHTHPERFHGRLRFLIDERYNILPLAHALERLYSGTLPERAVALTFDDGFVDFHRVALPLLRQYDLPATLYLATQYCEYNRPVFNLVCPYLLWKKHSQVAANQLLGWNSPVDLSTDAGRRAAWTAIRHTAQSLSVQGRDEIAEVLAKHLGFPYEEILAKRVLHIMNPEETAAAAALGISIQLHTHRHRTPSDKSSFTTELRQNSDCIARYTGKRPNHFCYPSGDARPEFGPWLQDFGISSAPTCVPGAATSSSRPLYLPRYLDSDVCSEVDFEAWVAGFDTFVRGRRAC